MVPTLNCKYIATSQYQFKSKQILASKVENNLSQRNIRTPDFRILVSTFILINPKINILTCESFRLILKKFTSVTLQHTYKNQHQTPFISIQPFYIQYQQNKFQIIKH